MNLFISFLKSIFNNCWRWYKNLFINKLFIHSSYWSLRYISKFIMQLINIFCLRRMKYCMSFWYVLLSISHNIGIRYKNWIILNYFFS